MMVEAAIAIVAMKRKIKTILEKRKAFDENTAVDPEEAKIVYK